MSAYIGVVGCVSFFIGCCFGIFLICLMQAAKTNDEDICHGCFGAANNDCKNCTRKINQQTEGLYNFVVQLFNFLFFFGCR